MAGCCPAPAATAPGAASERQLAIQNQVEDRARQAITTLLTPIVGAGNFTTEVHAEMDFSETQSTREGFPADQRAMTAEEGQVSAEGGERRAARRRHPRRALQHPAARGAGCRCPRRRGDRPRPGARPPAPPGRRRQPHRELQPHLRASAARSP